MKYSYTEQGPACEINIQKVEVAIEKVVKGKLCVIQSRKCHP